MAIKKKVSIKNVVFNFLEDIGGQDHKMQPTLTRWGVDGDYKIQSAYAYPRKICVLQAKGCHIEIPCEVVLVKHILPGDHGCDCGLEFDAIYRRLSIVKGNVDSAGGFLVIDLGGGQVNKQIKWQVVNNNIVLNQDCDGQLFTVDTKAYVTDEDGFPMVNWNHVDALSAYLEFKLAKRTRWNKKLGNITETGIKELFRDWTRLCAEARADDEEYNESEQMEIADMYNNPMTGGQIGVWLY